MSTKRDSFRQALARGWEDRVLYGLLRVEQLYRRGWAQRLAWRLGWEFGNATTKTPLRTAKNSRGKR
jgi:hypothetical protein